MGTKLNFNIEDAGLSVDGSEKFNSSGAAQNITISGDKITSGTVASARLPYTLEQMLQQALNQHLVDTYGLYTRVNKWQYMLTTAEHFDRFPFWQSTIVVRLEESMKSM